MISDPECPNTGPDERLLSFLFRNRKQIVKDIKSGASRTGGHKAPIMQPTKCCKICLTLWAPVLCTIQQVTAMKSEVCNACAEKLRAGQTAFVGSPSLNYKFAICTNPEAAGYKGKIVMLPDEDFDEIGKPPKET